ncbi:MAG: hypothetical protein ACRDRB_16445, partial [Pseudonocardiaceae bacterium]
PAHRRASDPVEISTTPPRRAEKPRPATASGPSRGLAADALPAGWQLPDPAFLAALPRDPRHSRSSTRPPATAENC